MTPSEGQGVVPIGGFEIGDCDFEAAKRRILSCLNSGSRLAVFFANTHFIVTCQPLRAAIARNPSVFILNDGIGLSLARQFLQKGRFAENLNGTDFIPRLLREGGRPLRLYLLGSAKASVEGAALAFGRIAPIEVLGACDGYSFWPRQADIIEEINVSRPDILLVALGCPLQEKWTLDNFAGLNVPIIFGVGALFDFISGQQARAPGWMRKSGLEWLYRLWREPRRLIYRYTIEIVEFVRIVLHSRKA